MGLQLRIEALVASNTDDAKAASFREAGRRLVDPAGMGTEYMVLGIGGQPDKGVVWPFVDVPPKV
jgi:NADH dehydrogenase [ubiquinone] 1 alpha subcomplex assembly factor 7